MINPNELGPRPNTREQKHPLPISGEVVNESLRNTIEGVKRKVEKRVRLGQKDLGQFQSLCTLRQDVGIVNGFTKLQIDTKRAQESAFDLMKEYGLDEKKASKPEYFRWDTNVVVETTIYPSQAIKGLEFHRRKRSNDTGQLYEVEWLVVDNAPKYKITL